MTTKRAERRRKPALAHARAGARGGARRTVRLGQGDVGYLMAPDRLDDCLRPAIATVLQVPVEQVPDPRLDARLDAGEPEETIVSESWARIEAWLDKRGLELVLHDKVPARRRWIGVCRPVLSPKQEAHAAVLGLTATTFNDHAVVMSYDQIVFDPGMRLPAPAGWAPRAWRLDDVAYGMTFDPKE